MDRKECEHADTSSSVELDGTNFIINGTAMSFYELLGIQEGSSFTSTELTKRYKKLSLRYHPDRQTGDAELFKALNRAFETIKDDESRRRYDAEREDESGCEIPRPSAGRLFGGPSASDLERQKLEELAHKYQSLAPGSPLFEFFNVENALREALSQHNFDSAYSFFEDTAIQRSDAVVESGMQVGEKLAQSFYNCDYFGVVQIVYSNSPGDMTVDAFESTLRQEMEKLIESQRQAIGEDGPPRFVTFSRLCKALFDRLNGDLLAACEGVRDVLLACPLKDVSRAVAMMMEKDDALHRCMFLIHCVQFLENDVFARTAENTVSPPTNFKFQKWFKGSPSRQIQNVRRFEKGILNQIHDSRERALSYLDLVAVCETGTTRITSEIISLQWLVEAMKTETDQSQLFALQHTVNTKCLSWIFVFLRGVLSPQCRLLFLQEIVRLVMECNRLCDRKIQAVEPSQTKLWTNKQFWKIVVDMILYLGSICPVSNLKPTLACDLVYTDLVARNCLNAFVDFRSSRGNESNVLCDAFDVSFLRFEGVWKYWGNWDEEPNADDSKNADEAKMPDRDEKRRQVFYETRFDFMERLSLVRGQSLSKLEQILSWPMLPRTSDGFLDISQGICPLVFGASSGQLFESIDGVDIDVENGTIRLQLVPASCPQAALFSQKDIDEVFGNGIGGAFFSLEEPSKLKYGVIRDKTRQFENDPLQQMRFGPEPERLARTDYMLTMFHADYLLKMITQGTEMSSNPPFMVQNVFENGFMSVLDPILVEELDLHELCQHTNEDRRTEDVTGKAHRFWIDADSIEYKQDTVNNQVIQIRFGEVDVQIRTHLLRRNLDQTLVDDENDDGKSAEAMLAQNLTYCYETLCDNFYIFDRIRELSKLSAVYRVIAGHYEKLQSLLQQCSSSKYISEAQTKLTSIRSNIISQLPCFPLTNHVNAEMERVLRDNNVTRSQVSSSELSRVQSKIQSSLQSQQNTVVSDITNAVAQGYGVGQHEISSYVYGWLCGNSSQANQIATICGNRRMQNERARLQRGMNYITSTMRVRISPNTEQRSSIEPAHPQLFAPAIYSDRTLVTDSTLREGQQIYGGVAMFSRLASVVRLFARGKSRWSRGMGIGRKKGGRGRGGSGRGGSGRGGSGRGGGGGGGNGKGPCLVCGGYCGGKGRRSRKKIGRHENENFWRFWQDWKQRGIKSGQKRYCLEDQKKIFNSIPRNFRQDKSRLEWFLKSHDCSHIKSSKNGGSNNVSNLFWSHSSVNKSNGAKNVTREMMREQKANPGLLEVEYQRWLRNGRPRLPHQRPNTKLRFQK